MLAATFGRERQQRHRRFRTQQSLSRRSGSDGDIGQLRRRRIHHNGAIGESEHAVHPKALVLHRDQKDARHGLHRGTDAMQRRPHGLGRSVRRPADEAIGIACRHHQRREVKWSPCHRRRLHLRNTLGPPPLVVESLITRQPRARRRIIGLDQDRLQQLLALQPRRRRLYPQVVAFRKHNPRTRRHLPQPFNLPRDKGFG